MTSNAFVIEHINDALAAYQRSWSKQNISIEKKLKNAFPNFSKIEINELTLLCEEIETYANTLAEKVRTEKLTIEIFKKLMKEAFPFLNAARLSRAIDQAIFISMK